MPAESFGAEVRTSSPVERDRRRRRHASHGVTTADGRVLRAPIVVAATHPQITFLRQIDPAELPADFVADLRRWRSRSGTVKVNVALSELPDFLAWPGTEPHERFTGSVELCHSIEYVQRAFQDARDGRAARPAVLRRRHPVDARPDAGPDGTHVMSLFTQWVPSSWSDEPHRDELEQYADRVIDGYTELAPELQAVRHPPPGHRTVGDGARVRPDRWQHLPR